MISSNARRAEYVLPSERHHAATNPSTKRYTTLEPERCKPEFSVVVSILEGMTPRIRAHGPRYALKVAREVFWDFGEIKVSHRSGQRAGKDRDLTHPGITMKQAIAYRGAAPETEVLMLEADRYR